ncbi:hypothetical protein Tco_0284542, partial [Tanacetum coccineum]
VPLMSGKVSISATRPNQVPTGRPKLVSTGRLKPVPTGKPKVPEPVPTGRQNRPFPVPSGRRYSPSVTPSIAILLCHFTDSSTKAFATKQAKFLLGLRLFKLMV